MTQMISNLRQYYPIYLHRMSRKHFHICTYFCNAEEYYNIFKFQSKFNLYYIFSITYETIQKAYILNISESNKAKTLRFAIQHYIETLGTHISYIY